MARQKTSKLLITFPSTTVAIAMEKMCKAKQLPGRLIPVPREITAGCGMAWCALPEVRETLVQVMEESGIQAEGLYEMLL